MTRIPHRALAVSICAIVFGVGDAGAFRMIQNTSTGPTSFGAQVTCDDANGFAHRATSAVTWLINPGNQASKAGVVDAFQQALTSWNNVTPAGYTLSYGGTTNAGFSVDGVNTVVWATGNGCSGSCLAITAIVLAPGQVITEADISFNNAATWNTDGSDVDVEAIAAHELGHSMGIHHTEITKPRNRPTMYASYFGVNGRSLESDDWAALNCAYTRYPPAAASPAVTSVAGVSGPEAGPADVTLASRARPGGAILRYALSSDEDVKIDVYDIAGRRLNALVNAREGAGQHEVAWDGSTGSGRVRSGVYFARIVTRRGSARATVVLAE